MRTIGLFEAKAEAFGARERAREGERSALLDDGELAAVLVPAAPESQLERYF